MINSSSIANLISALNKAQKEFDPILKDKDNPYFRSKYADLEACIKATQPTLIKFGLAVVQFPHSEEGGVGCLTILAHTSGELIAESFALPLAKKDAQTGVAAVTYARRTGYLGVLGLAAEDDDGNTASAKYDEEPERAKPYPKSTGVSTSGPKVASEAKEESVPLKANRVDADSSRLPTEEEKSGFRTQYSELMTDLASAGLGPSKGLPVPKKLLNFLLFTTGFEDSNKITLEKWGVFFSVVKETLGETKDFKKLIKVIDVVNKQEEAKA